MRSPWVQIKHRFLNIQASNIEANEWVAWSGQIGTFQDLALVDADEDDYEAWVDWGDGSSAEQVTIQALSGEGNFEVVGEHTYPNSGNFEVTLTILSVHDSSFELEDDAPVVVDNLAPLFDLGSDSESGNYEGTVFERLDLQVYRIGNYALAYGEVDWGDGSTPEELEIGPFGYFDLSHTYTDDGVYEITVTIWDDQDAWSEDSFFVTVAGVPPTAQIANNGPVVVNNPATFTFSNMADASEDDESAGFTYSFDFNDDGDFTDANEVSGSSQHYASYTWTSTGSGWVRCRITDKDGLWTDYWSFITIEGP